MSLEITVHEHPGQIPAPDWDGLLEAQPWPTPFMRHAHLLALHESGSATPATGWHPRFVTLHQGGALMAACPLYLKEHSWGEYVFDFGLAQAYRQHQLAYYPKHLVAVPFTPVPGTRLMAQGPVWRRRLAQTLIELTQAQARSSLHVLLADDADAAALTGLGCRERTGVQFHWTRDPARPAADFAALLASLQRDKRKKIRQEQRRVVDAGIRFEVHEGPAITVDDWHFFYRCHARTYAVRGQQPYQTPAFFAAVARRLAECWVMFTAWQGEARVAASLIAVDRARRTAWGRHWGCVQDIDCLHFDACYYQPLAWVLDQGLDRFEGGAQGEHKVARGLLPRPTRSLIWLADTRFDDALAEALALEAKALAAHVAELDRRTPFKAQAG